MTRETYEDVPLPDDEPVEPPAPRVPCFGCGLIAAGNERRPASAYCGGGCQPLDDHPVIGAAWMCPVCYRQVGTLGDFDRHQRHHPRGHLDFGAFTGECIDPATFGDLILVDGVWLTEAGRRKRAQPGCCQRPRGARGRQSPLETRPGS